MRNTVAMVLAGGRVSELGVLTLDRPKSAVPFGGLYRVIDFPLSNLMHSGINRVGILSQYRSYPLMTHIGNGEPWDFYGRNRSVHVLPPFKGYQPSDWYRGTADAVFQNLDFFKNLQAEKVLILSGDHIYGMDYKALFDFHTEMDADITVAFKKVPIEQASRFGLGKIADESPAGGRLLAYQEKPESASSCWASMTVYLFKAEVLELLLKSVVEDQHKTEFGRDMLPFVLEDFNVYGFKFDGYWGYTRTISEYYQTNMCLLKKDAPIRPDVWQVRTNLANRMVRDREPAHIAASANIKNSLIYNGCQVAGSVENSILFPGVCVEAGAVVKDAIIMFDGKILEKSRVHKAIIDSNAVIGRGANIGDLDSVTDENKTLEQELVMIGRRANISEQADVLPGQQIYPAQYR